LGGSTFARAFKKGCAFGPEFKGKEYNIHDANEQVSKEDLIKSYQIYKRAIFNLAKID
jgi:acetylornithine deacetylase/succinyl-diaminopimelate desuccinylase-like protein